MKVQHDLYLEELVEYYLEEYIKNNIDLYGDEKIQVILENRFSKSNVDFTVEKLNDNSEMIFDNPNISYFCSVTCDPLNSERNFMIFQTLVDKLTPTGIYFHYINGEKIYIDSENFENIHSMKDILILQD